MLLNADESEGLPQFEIDDGVPPLRVNVIHQQVFHEVPLVPSNRFPPILHSHAIFLKCLAEINGKFVGVRVAKVTFGGIRQAGVD